LALSLTVSEIRSLIKHPVQNCGQTAAGEDVVTIDCRQEVASARFDSTIADPYDLLFSYNTARLAYHSAL